MKHYTRISKLLLIFTATFVFAPHSVFAEKASKELAAINSVLVATVKGSNALVLDQIFRDTAKEELSFEVKIPKKDSDCSSYASVGADACLYIEVADYTERTGSSLSAANTASIDFTVHLVRDAGKDVWSSRFTFQDTTLTENIVQFGQNVSEKGGSASFTTARALFEKGVRDALRKLNDERTNQFLN